MARRRHLWGFFLFQFGTGFIYANMTIPEAQEAAKAARKVADDAAIKAQVSAREAIMQEAVVSFCKQQERKSVPPEWSRQWAAPCKAYADAAQLPSSTFKDRVVKYLQSGNTSKKKPGRHTALSAFEIQSILIPWIKFLQESKRSARPCEIRAKAGDIMSSRGVNHMPGKRWFDLFMHANEEQLKPRVTRSLSQIRGKVSQQEVQTILIFLYFHIML